MGKGEAARKVATAAALGGGGLSLLGGSVYGLLRAEVQWARRSIGVAEGDPPAATGWYGGGRGGPALKIALLGDSTAAGYGVEHVEETPGARLGSGVAEAADRRVYVASVPRVGAQTKDLAPQVERVLPLQPHVAVILIGANDVTHAVRLSTSVRLLRESVVRLRDHGVEVVVGTCPDLGTLEPLAPPLRQVARLWSQRLAEDQTVAVVEAGGRTVSLGSVLGPEFARLSELLFGPDRFHPSPAGYGRLSSVLLPSVLAAVGVVPEEDVRPEPGRGEGRLPIREAAHVAARTPGTEIEPEVGAATRGAPWGRFVQLRRRRRQPAADVETPQRREGQVAPQETVAADGSPEG